jgi:acyl-CoA thioester hydrolase
MICYDHPVKVYYKDIDQMGIVYYSRYFEFFEEARTELLNSIGLDVTAIEENGIYLPVITSQCDYKKGAEFEQEIVVKTSISDLPKSRLTIKYEVVDSVGTILVTGYTIHAFMKKNGRPTKVPETILKTLKQNMKPS